MKPIILSFQNIMPQWTPTTFVAPNAAIIGDVQIGEQSSVWFNCTIRGDVNFIRIGARTNIQDGAVIHCADKKNGDLPTIIGDDVTVGHLALVHAAKVGNRCLIGMQSCLMDGAVVEDDAIVAAGALVTPGKRVEAGQLWAGRPARHVRDLTADEKQHLIWSSSHYVRLASQYL